MALAELLPRPMLPRPADRPRPDGPATLLIERDPQRVAELSAWSSSATVEQAQQHLALARSADIWVNGPLLAPNLPEEALRAACRELPPARWSLSEDAAELLLHRVGEDALPVLQASADRIGAASLLVLAPWAVLPVTRLETVAALRYLSTHRGFVTPVLLHAACLGADLEQQHAERALRWLSRSDRAGMVALARVWGPDWEAALEVLLSPERASNGLFSRPLPKLLMDLPLVGREGSPLDAKTREQVVRRLASSLPFDHPGLTTALGLCDPSSLAALTQALFEAWVEGRMATQNQWIIEAHLVTGGEAAARQQGRLARRWARSRESHERRAARAVIRSLGAVASDAALAELASCAATVRDAAERAAVTFELERVALERGMRVDDLAAPDLPTEWSFDYGPRTFLGRLDARLTLALFEGERPIEELPRPNKKDDAARAKAAKEAYREARETVRDAVTAEVARLEGAMVTERAWPASRFSAHLAGSAIARLVAGRVLFGVRGDGAVTTTFRVAEDGTLASIEDARLELPEDAHVLVVHPLALDEATRARWEELFASYELLAPFPQLSRTVHRSLEALKSASLHAGAVMGLRDRGWRLTHLHWPFVDGARRAFDRGALELRLRPTFSFHDLASAERQTIAEVTLHGHPSPIDLSEAVRDLVG